MSAHTQETTAPNAGAVFKTAYKAYVLGIYDDAIRNFNLAISMDPSRHYFYYNRGMTYKAMGQKDMAMADFQKSNALRQTAECYYQIGLIKYERNDYKGAKEDFESAKMMKDDIERLNFCLGMIYYRYEDYADALKCFQDYTFRIKDQADAYYYRGMSEAKLGEYQQAIASFKFALRYKDRDWIYYYKMYEFYMALGDKQNALNSISMVIEIGETKVEHYKKRAELYKELGLGFKYDEDIKSIEKLGMETAAVKGS